MLAAPPQAHTCTPMLHSQGSIPPSTAAPVTDHLEGPRPRCSPAKDKCTMYPCHSLGTRHPRQPHSPLGFLISCSPEAFAQHLSLQHPRTDLIDVTPIIQVSLNAELMHLCVQTS